MGTALEIFSKTPTHGSIATTIWTWNELWDEVREIALDMGTTLANKFLAATITECDTQIYNWGIIVHERKEDEYNELWNKLLCQYKINDENDNEKGEW